MTKPVTDKDRRLRIQSVMAIASFTIGVILASICLFLIEPYGEIHTSAISIVSELFILAGSLLGISASFDAKMQKFRAEVEKEIIKTPLNEELPDE